MYSPQPHPSRPLRTPENARLSLLLAMKSARLARPPLRLGVETPLSRFIHGLPDRLKAA